MLKSRIRGYTLSLILHLVFLLIYGLVILPANNENDEVVLDVSIIAPDEQVSAQDAVEQAVPQDFEPAYRVASANSSEAVYINDEALLSEYEHIISTYLKKHIAPDLRKIAKKYSGNIIFRIRIKNDGQVVSAQIDKTTNIPQIDQFFVKKLSEFKQLPRVPATYANDPEMEFLFSLAVD
jgi:hypothetical protein